MKDYLNKLIKNKSEKLNTLRSRIDAAQTADEVRSLTAEAEEIQAEIRDAKNQLAALEASENITAAAESTEARAQFDPARVIAAAEMNNSNNEARDEDPLATMEYRTAFMRYVQRGAMSTVLQEQMTARQASQVIEGDLGVLVPTTVVNDIIKNIEKVYGQLYSRVKKTNVAGGVKYPIGSFEARFTRVTETTVSERQKGGQINGYVQFGYNIGEVRIAKTLLAGILSVPAFEKELTDAIIKAYVRAMDYEIMLGDADKEECEGILTEANKPNGGRIGTSHIIEFTAADMADWTAWQKKLFAVIPLGMRNQSYELVMTANTYESNIKTLKDSNNRPVYNETFNPVDGAEIAKFKGKDVVFVEDDILKSFDDASAGEYFGMVWVPEMAYAINSNLEFYIKHYFDDERNQFIDKATVINDGKILNPGYIYLLKKKADSE